MVGGPNRLGSPIVAAPMAGGPSNPRLAVAASDARAFAFLAGGYKTAETLAGEVAEVRRTGAVFGVNLFAPNTAAIDPEVFRRYAAELQADADDLGIDLSRAGIVEDDDGWRDKLDLLIADPIPVVSVTFGLTARMCAPCTEPVATS